MLQKSVFTFVLMDLMMAICYFSMFNNFERYLKKKTALESAQIKPASSNFLLLFFKYCILIIFTPFNLDFNLWKNCVQAPEKVRNSFIQKFDSFSQMN